MTGELNSLCVNTGDVIGEGKLSVPALLGILGFAMRNGEDGGGGPLPGE